MVTAAGFGTHPFEGFAGQLLRQFARLAGIALLMSLVIQPVRRVGPASGWTRVVALSGSVVVACMIGSTALLLWQVTTDGQFDAIHSTLLAAPAEEDNLWPVWRSNMIRFLSLATMLVAVAEFHRREVQSLESMREAESQRTSLEHESLEARVKTLEAQIEPHFLFNTLANVRRLYETDAAAGDTMLTQLMRYLEIALPSMRGEHSTLEREAELISAYLNLQQVRMGKRLAYTIDIKPELRQMKVPPMMLLTLVENAIKHGLTPLREGGRIDISASRIGAELRLDVADNGRGFGSEISGGGTGLANIRARLAAMFGTVGVLTLIPGNPRGLTATITLPVPA
jgi:hypothetical protein